MGQLCATVFSEMPGGQSIDGLSRMLAMGRNSIPQVYEVGKYMEWLSCFGPSNMQQEQEEPSS